MEEKIASIRYIKLKWLNAESHKKNTIHNSGDHGLEHTNWRGNVVPKRQIGPDCRCPRKCIDLVSDPEKQGIIDRINSFNTKDEQDIYLHNILWREWKNQIFDPGKKTRKPGYPISIISSTPLLDNVPDLIRSVHPYAYLYFKSPSLQELRKQNKFPPVYMKELAQKANECEDEWGEMRDRFKKEGLDFETLKLEDRILQVWRWLVDAEINLRNSRRMLDKLHEQQHEEIEEMENYIGKMRKLAEKRSDDLENERVSLFKEKEKLESLLISENIIGKNLLDKVAKLLEERNQVINDLEALKAFKLSADTNINNDDEMLSEIIKVSFEKESLKREVAELTDRVSLLEKSSRQLEIDNERLSFKLSEALAEIEERETQLGLSPSTWINDTKGRQSDISRCSKDFHETESKEISPKEALSNSFHKEPSQSYGADSTPPSLLVSELASFGSPKKLSSLLESCNELAWIEEVKKLQTESENLRTQLTVLGERYNTLALRHIQYKAKRKFQMDEIRERLEACECQVETLQSQLSVQRQRLRAEEIFRKQIEADYRRLQDEKRTLAARLLNAETHQREEGRELAILQRKVALLDTANSELVAQLMKLKYKSNMTKSTTCDDMLSNVTI